MRVRAAAAAIAIAACSGQGTKPTTNGIAAPSRPAGVDLAPASTVVAANGSAASSPPGPAGTPPSSGAPAVKVTLADVGLESGSLDRTIDPCVDFYQFTCGDWIASTSIPGDRTRWGRGDELDERTKLAIKGLLDEAAKGFGADAATKKLGEFYASCMDEQAIEKAGTSSIRAALDKTTKVNDPKTWFAALTELHTRGAWVVWEATAQPDLKDGSTNVTYLDAAGLGLPDRDDYTKPERKDKLDAYKLHVGKVLALVGTPAPRAERAAADVVAIETELAKLTTTVADKRDAPAAYNPTDAKGLGRQVKSIDWKAYWKALSVEPSPRIVVGAPRLFAQIDKLRVTYKPAQWASYFTYHLVESAAFALPKAFDDEAFELQKVLTGVELRHDRSTRCIEATEGALGELLGQRYAAKYFPGSSRQTTAMLIDAIVKAMAEQLATLDWLSDGTKAIAQAKLATLVRMIGFPDKWRTYDFEVKRDEFGGNVARAAAFETHRRLAKAGKPVDRGDWQVNTYEVSASYEPITNHTALPAGILQPPFFGPDRSVAANLGGIGVAVARELTRGFDDQSGWPKDDKAKFDERGTCVADMYSTFEALPKSFVQGRLTLDENIADLGGVKLAWKAYRSLRRDATKVYVADGFSEDQQFFIAVGQAWCTKDRPAEAQRRLAVDPQAPPKFRVYGALRNLPEFAAAFACPAGTPMHPAKSCSVW